MIVNLWIQKITGGTAIRPNESERLQEFADKLKSCYTTLSCMKHFGEIDNQFVLVKILEQLPNY